MGWLAWDVCKITLMDLSQARALTNNVDKKAPYERALENGQHSVILLFYTRTQYLPAVSPEENAIDISPVWLAGVC